MISSVSPISDIPLLSVSLQRAGQEATYSLSLAVMINMSFWPTHLVWTCSRWEERNSCNIGQALRWWSNLPTVKTQTKNTVIQAVKNFFTAWITVFFVCVLIVRWLYSQFWWNMQLDAAEAFRILHLQ